MRSTEHDAAGTITAVTLTCDYCGQTADVVTAQAAGWGIVVRNLDATTESDMCSECLALVARVRSGAGVP